MNQKKSFFSEILIRKIPQLVGMYIASVWLAVEISDWMTGRFNLPTQLATYVFVGMLTMLPSVILVVWGHGRAGKDTWTKLEKFLVPINLIITIFLLSTIVSKNKVKLETENIKDKPFQISSIHKIDKSKIIPYELFKQKHDKNNVLSNYSKASNVFDEETIYSKDNSIISYFWDNKTEEVELNWLSYAASWLISQDLNRTPLISVNTPYESAIIFNKLVGKGFKKALNIPLSLKLNIANNRSSKWIIDGSFYKINQEYEFIANIYDVVTGKKIETVIQKGEDVLFVLDEIANRVSLIVNKKSYNNENTSPQLAIAEHTSKNLEAIKYFIKAKNEIIFNNNFKQALSLLLKAKSIDDKFANIYVLSMEYYTDMGDFPNAIVQAHKALDLDYKLYIETVYLIRSQLLSIQGEQRKAIKVLEKWVELYPQSTQALNSLGESYLKLGNYHDKAKKIFRKLYRAEGSGHKALINLGKIYRLENDKENTLEILINYKNANPSDTQAYLELAAAYKQFAMLDKSAEMYEEASLFGSKNLNAEIGLANLQAAKSDFRSAIFQFFTLLNQCKTDQQKIDVLSNLLVLFIQTGQIKRALDIVKQMEEPSKRIKSPLTFTLEENGTKILLLSMLGKFNQAKEIIDAKYNDLLPPFDKYSMYYIKNIYEYQHDKKKYLQAIDGLESLDGVMNITGILPDILRAKGKFAFWNHKYEEALNYINQALNNTKYSITTLMSNHQVDDLLLEKAKYLLALNKFDNAIESLDSILARSPLYAKAHFLKAQVYFKTGNKEMLIIELKKAREIWNEADEEYLDYIELIKFEEVVNSASLP